MARHLPAEEAGEPASRGGEIAVGAGKRSMRRVVAVIGGGVALVALVVAVVASAHYGRSSELAATAWGDDPEVAKMQSTIDSLTQSLDHTKREIQRADATKVALEAQRREDAKATELSRRYNQQSEHALRDV